MPESRRRLVRLEARTAWIYAEYTVLGRHEDQLTLVRDHDTLIVPSGTLGAVMLGPGTSVTHPGMDLLAENCVTLLWVRGGGLGVFHSSTPPSFTRGSSAVRAQARVVSDPELRLTAAREMYSQRFPGGVPGDTLQAMMQAEGVRVKARYRELSEQFGLHWKRRGPGEEPDLVNRNLDYVNHMIYGVCEVVTGALGLSAGLGIVHEGNARAFIFDLADLYKSEVAPVAFQAAAEGLTDASELRARIRTWVWENKLFNRAINDVTRILNVRGEAVSLVDTQTWWDGESA
ncbi:CRISPR-associated endonuclease Cas1 [Corynebacterium variabile]|uniref:CRISPR-associated endonuclease Cas1 n=1 Tax=Corynebacterium variabile TaxID=1727 RepID=UPI003FD26E66